MTGSDSDAHARSSNATQPRAQSKRGNQRRSSKRSGGKSASARASNSKRGGEGEHLLGELRDIVQKNLDQATYIVFDIETTGGNPERNGITEIAALKISEGKVVDRFYTLVNPMIPIPPIVRRMTGITNQLVKDSPVIDEIFPDFVDFIEDHILVSHNTIGDLIFLRHFALDTIGRDLRNFFLCTHLLVEKLAGDAPDKSLKGLSKFFNLEGAEFHRAEADAIQTWELFKILLKRLKERGVSKVEHAIRLQGDLDSSFRLGWSIPKEKLQDLPNTTGVFYLYDHERRLLFLSSAQSISREVAKLQQHDLIPRQILKLSLRSYDLQLARMPSLFAAMLAECEGREKYHIQADPASFHQRQVQVLGVYEDKDGQQRIIVGPPENNLKVAFGPLRDRKKASDFVEELAEILGEKVTRSGMIVSAEHKQLVLSLLSGSLLEYQRKLEKNLFGLRFLFWKRDIARETRMLLGKIQSMVGLQEVARSPWPAVSSLNGVIVVPDEGSQNWQIYPIVGGLPVGCHQIRGEWQTKICQGGLGKRIYSKLERDMKARQASNVLSQADIGRLNAVLWWLQYGKVKDRGVYLSLEEFSSLLSLKSSKQKPKLSVEKTQANETVSDEGVSR